MDPRILADYLDTFNNQLRAIHGISASGLDALQGDLLTIATEVRALRHRAPGQSSAKPVLLSMTQVALLALILWRVW
jgi:hypothetical protein